MKAARIVMFSEENQISPQEQKNVFILVKNWFISSSEERRTQKNT